jgi:hypothetical protein
MNIVFMLNVMGPNVGVPWRERERSYHILSLRCSNPGNIDGINSRKKLECLPLTNQGHSLLK